MPEHEHHPEDHVHEHSHMHDEARAFYKKTAKLISTSVIVAAVLVCAGIFYNTYTIHKDLKSLGLAIATPAAPSVATAGQQAAAPTPAAGPVTITDRANEPTLGSSSAKVTMVEFGDFQCPYCKQYFTQNFAQIKSQYIDTGKVKLIFRDFPLTSIHVNAQIAAEAAECANQQGKFWQYHDILYTDGQSDGTGLDKASLEKYADGLGLNSGTLGFGKNKFDQCLESNATLPIVQADQAEGTKDGVTGTPTFFINGVSIVGAEPLSSFQAALDSALKQ